MKKLSIILFLIFIILLTCACTIDLSSVSITIDLSDVDLSGSQTYPTPRRPRATMTWDEQWLINPANPASPLY